MCMYRYIYFHIYMIWADLIYEYHKVINLFDLYQYLILKLFCKSSFILSVSSVAQSLSRVRLCNPMDCSMPSLPVHHQLLEFTQTQVHRVGDATQPSHLLSSPSSPAPNPSQHQGLFQWVNSLHEVAKVLEFQLQHQSFQSHPGLISFRMDWLDLLAVQGILKSLLQHRSSKASIFRHSAFFTVQLSHPYMTTGKTIALSRQTFVGKVISHYKHCILQQSKLKISSAIKCNIETSMIDSNNLRWVYTAVMILC